MPDVPVTAPIKKDAVKRRMAPFVKISRESFGAVFSPTGIVRGSSRCAMNRPVKMAGASIKARTATI